ncbi:MAG: hypothetical protein IPG76_22005 [Acidobacteria bacterium]|nr:hypothetical protein [Acidobacteriota bacterium]
MSDNGLSRTEAIRAAARSRGMTRREAYQIMLGRRKRMKLISTEVLIASRH